MEQSEFFECLQAFVPDGYQVNPKDFLQYVRSLLKPVKTVYKCRYYMIVVANDGIEATAYRPQYTPTIKYNWTAIENIVKEQPRFRLPSLFEQLKGAF